jgi:ADP-ribose pyrophosphatase YjhB (NUDIX family)
MAIFTWKKESVPKELKITQVYGIIFSRDGRVLLKVEEKRGKKEYSFAGGHPEIYDSGISETLRREVIEEVNITVCEPVFVGYQEVDEENGTPLYAQVRMTALIDELGAIRPDIDNGKTYGRLLAPPMRAAELLGWGEVGFKQISAAMEIAVNTFKISEFSEKEEYI